MSIPDKPTVLIFGATGGIGNALVRELIADSGLDDVKVRAAVRRQDAADSLKRRGVESVILDLSETERLPLTRNTPLLGALEGVDRLFLLTGYTVEMLAQSKAVLDAAKLVGVKHVVHLGAWGADDTTIVHLGWHQFIERYIEWAGFHFTHLRPNVFMQNILRFSLQSDGTIHQFIGDAAVSWIDTDDIAIAAAAVLRSPQKHIGKSYPLAVESMDQVAGVLSEVVGRPFRYEPCSPDEWLAAAIKSGMEPAYAKCVHNVFRRTAGGSLYDAADVFDSFEKITGRKPNLWREYAQKHQSEFTRRIAA